VLEGLQRILVEPGSQVANFARRGGTHGGVRVERVYLDESGPEHEVTILFRDLDRPDCLFGYRIEAIETPDVLNERTNHHSDLLSAARAWGEVVWVLRGGGLRHGLRATPRLLPRGRHLDIGAAPRTGRC